MFEFLFLSGIFSIVYSFLANLSVFFTIITAFVCSGFFLFIFKIVAIALKQILNKRPQLCIIASISLSVFIYENLRTYLLHMPWGNISDIIVFLPAFKFLLVLLPKAFVSSVVVFFVFSFLFARKRQDYFLTLPLLLTMFVFMTIGFFISRPWFGEEKPLNIMILESGYSYNEKLSAGFVGTFDLYRKLLAKARTGYDLVLLPETAFNLPMEMRFARELLGGIFEESNSPILFGAVINRKGKYYNCAVLWDNGKLEAYSKRRLVPFGEYVPLKYIPALYKLYLKINPFYGGEFSPGKQKPFLMSKSRDLTILPLICYEDGFWDSAYPYYRKSDLIVVLTSDIWFGRPIAQLWHCASSYALALSTQRPVVRVSTAGPSCVFLPNGSIVYPFPVVRDKHAKALLLSLRMLKRK